MYREHTPPDPNPPKFLTSFKEEEEKKKKTEESQLIYYDKLEILKQILNILKDL